MRKKYLNYYITTFKVVEVFPGLENMENVRLCTSWENQYHKLDLMSSDL